MVKHIDDKGIVHNYEPVSGATLSLRDLMEDGDAIDEQLKSFDKAIHGWGYDALDQIVIDGNFILYALSSICFIEWLIDEAKITEVKAKKPFVPYKMFIEVNNERTHNAFYCMSRAALDESVSTFKVHNHLHSDSTDIDAARKQISKQLSRMDIDRIYKP